MLLVVLYLLLHLDACQAARAAEPVVERPIVPGFERFYGSDTLDDAAAGRLLLGELNCVSCHRAADESGESRLRKQAPVLDDVGRRVRVEYLRRFIADPHGTKPGTTMPDMFAGIPPAERAARVEALVHFLATTGSIVERLAERKRFQNGQKLFHTVGCTACHAPLVGGPLESTVSVPLPQLSEKYTVDSLETFLEDPLKVRPSGRMPGLPLDEEETRDLAHYLLRDLAGLTVLGRIDLPKIPYRYYEGDWERLPDFSELQPQAQGNGAAFDVAIARRQNNFALEFEGWFFARHEGEYHFDLTSDDGSRLYVDGMGVVDNDGIHAPQTVGRRLPLAAGPHQVRAAVFNGGGGVELEISVAGPGLPQQSLAVLVAPSKEVLLKAIADEPPPDDDPDVFRLDPQLAAQGRELFASQGCAACHQLRVNLETIEPAKALVARAKPLRELRSTGGCLEPLKQAGAPRGPSPPRKQGAVPESATGQRAVQEDLNAPNSLAGAAGSDGKTGSDAAASTPRYHLSESQRSALAAALSSDSRLERPAPPADAIAQTLLRFNCYACHVRDGIGGVEAGRNALFHTTQPEMGDEGRIPPHLDGAGAKLTREWLRRIFARGANDRPYMLTRMPRFGEDNIGHLVAALEKTDTVDSVAVPEFELSDGRVKAHGREMVGDHVFGCVKCHNFNGIQATGVQSIDLTIMTRRLRRDWFHRYMLNPQAYRPGTRMPAAWPQGRTTLRDVLEGDTAKQIEAVWRYLSAGQDAGVPYGLAREMIELKPVDEAIIYRNFIQGAGPRAIAVGYPEQAHLAFDAQEMRLALIWQGAFMDASLHWTGRGAGFQMPLGDLVVALPEGPGFARLAAADGAWPAASAKELGIEFRGYRLQEDGRPTFLYDFGPIHIEDFPTAIATTPHPTIRRTLRVSSDSSAADLHFRAAAGEHIEQTADGAWLIDGELRIRLIGEGEPIVVESGGRSELRLAVPCNGQTTTITEEFEW